jgi:S-(hydroxymethyl)glutathione dehydrogenase / alcohol dehydrogenase
VRAVVFRDPARPVEVADVELDPPGPGEVRVRIAAAGVCHSDLHVRRGDWDVAVPLVMGHEGSGTVVATGAGVSGVREGDHVILSWVPACGRCGPCRAGHPARCDLCADVLAPQGVLYDGTTRLHRGSERIHHYLSVSSFAEEVVVPESGAIPVRRDAPLDVMALIGCAVATGVGAVRRTAAVPEGASVAVIGCGGVGVAAIQGARIAGAAEIVAIDPVESKHALAKKFGATHAVKPEDIDGVKNEVTGGEGFDYVLECVGHPATIRQCYDLARRGGTAVVVGVGRLDQQVQFSAFELFYGDKTLKGSMYGGANVRVDFHRLLRLWRNGKLDLEGMITRRIKLDEVNEAFRAMQAGEVIRSVIDYS